MTTNQYYWWLYEFTRCHRVCLHNVDISGQTKLMKQWHSLSCECKPRSNTDNNPVIIHHKRHAKQIVEQCNDYQARIDVINKTQEQVENSSSLSVETKTDLVLQLINEKESEHMKLIELKHYHEAAVKYLKKKKSIMLN